MTAPKSWNIQLNKRVPGRLKKHGKAVARKVKELLAELQSYPKRGKPLKHFPGVRSLPITTQSGEFRVIYRLLGEQKVILVDLIETREEVYKILMRNR